MDTELKNYYEILELSPKASQEEIRQAYLNLARLYHPDKNMNTDDRRMIELNRVYEVLSNPAKKKEYDQRFSVMQTYDFTKTKSDVRKAPQLGSKIKSGISPRQLKSALWYVLIACLCYIMLLLIVNIIGLFTALPHWLHLFFP